MHATHSVKNKKKVNNLREIQALRRLSPNQHVITLEEVLYDQPTGRLALVFELMNANLYELIRGRRHYLNGQVNTLGGRRAISAASSLWQKTNRSNLAENKFLVRR